MAEDSLAEQRLVGYIVPTVSPSVDKRGSNLRELRRFLKEKLPEYMVPSAFVVLDALPLTPNGK
jgi:acyl-coenzyme A synthetase/AMP-(fatty) acid ligase